MKYKWDKVENRIGTPDYTIDVGNFRALVIEPRHRLGEWHVVLWDRTDPINNVIETEYIVNHPGFTTPEDAMIEAERWLP